MISDPTGCSSGSSPAQGARWIWPVTGIAQAWADGAAGNGVMLRLANESAAVGDQSFERVFHSSTFKGTDARPPMLSVTYALPPEMGRLVAWPSVTLADGKVVVTSVTPELQARLADAATIPQRVELELEHDPSAPSQGTGLIWSGAVDSVPANAPALVKVPQGLLREGWNLRWRARASDGAVYSAWSVWQAFTLDTTVASPEVTCADYPAGQWSAKKSGATTCQVNNGTGKALPYSWGLDDATTSTQGSGGGTGGISNISITPDDGWHSLYVKIGNNVVSSYNFGVGPGGLTNPEPATRTGRAVALAARAAATWTGVRYEYRTDLTATGVWVTVPPMHVTKPGESTAITAWPMTRSDIGQPFGELAWEVAATLRAANRGDGPVQVRPCFTNGSAESCASPRLFLYGSTGFAASHALADVGPGTTSLVTGDFVISTRDGSVDGFDIGRTHTTLVPYTEQGVSGVFGPGWSASFSSGGGMSAYSLEDHSVEGYVQLVGPGRISLIYVVQADGSYSGVGDAADGSKIVKKSATEFRHITRGDVITKWTKDAQGRWTVNGVTPPVQESEVGYIRDAQGRYTRLLAPVPSGVTCSGSLVRGCRALDITYAATTTASGVASGWGDFAGQVKQLGYAAFDPVANTMRTTVVTTYAYDSTGHLRRATDARSGFSTVYYYNGQGRLSQIAPPGVEPWRLEYDSAGRFAHAVRTTPEGEAVYPVVFDVPVSGTGAPIDLSAAETAKWGQNADLPWTGAALFPPSHVPARGSDGAYRPGSEDWPHGSLTYMDISGRMVNNAGYGGGGWQISTTRYNERGLVTWSLSAGNRWRALNPDWTIAPFVAAQQTSSERANLLASVRTYDEQGYLRVAAGPAHEVMLSDRRLVTARGRTFYVYDEGKPTSGVDEFGTAYQDKQWHLVTTVRTEPLVLDGDTSVPAADVRVTETGYNPIKAGDQSGWKLGEATTERIVVGNGEPDLIKSMRYDAAGRLVESWAPGSNGNDSATIVTAYYTAGANATYPHCGNRPEWAGMACLHAPKQQPSGAALPVEENSSYDYFGALLSKKQTVGSVVRKSTTTYDSAGRVSTMGVAVTPVAAGGTPLAERRITYDPSSGLPKTISSDGETMTSDYDSLGREVTSTDATGNVAVTTYNIDGRVASVNDGKGVTQYTYDGTDARGNLELRGLLTGIQTSAGSFHAGYSADGRADFQVYPNNLWAASVYDSGGRQVAFSYGMDRMNWQPWLKWEEEADAAGTITQSVSPQSVNRFTYDRLGRLSKVEDVYDSVNCTTRIYAFDESFNRKRRDTHAPAPGGACSTATTPTTDTYVYNAAKHITNSGYSYDPFGRTTTVPAGHVDGGADLTVGYYADDKVASIVQDNESKAFVLDPAGRIRATTTVGGDRPGTTVNHYAGASGSPSWISEADGSWTRYIAGFEGMAVVQKSSNQEKVYLTNPHGDVVATVDNTASATGVEFYSEYTEYGAPRAANADIERYGWLGGGQHATKEIGGLTLMGGRLYNAETGRFLQTDNPTFGGSCNSYGYVCGDPVNPGGVEGDAAAPGPICSGPCLYREIKPSDKEAIACVWSFGKQQCEWGKQVADVAAEFARKRLGKAGEKETEIRSAVRHFIWQVLTTIAFGTEFAKEIADNHEKYSSRNKKESDFDQEVNRIARDYANANRDKLRKMWKEQGIDALLEYLYDEALFLFCGMKFGGFVIDCSQASAVYAAPEGTRTRFF